MNTTERAGNTGLKGIITVTVLLLLSAAAILLQIKYRGFEGPLSDNLLILILINANFLLLAAVIFLIGRSLWKLSVERRSKVLGAKFRTKLVTAFVSLSFIPTILLFIIGSGMYTRGIERLFSLRLESALQGSVSVSQSYYDRLKSQALAFGRQISRQIADERMASRFDVPVLREYLGKKAAEYGIGAVELFGEGRTSIARVVTDQFPGRTFIATPAEVIARALASEEMTMVSDLGKKGEIIRAVVPLYPEDTNGRIAGAVAVSYFIPSSLAHKVDEIQAGYAEYRSSFKSKQLLKMSYRLGFLAVMLTLLLAAIWVALRVAAGITVPIRKLAEGTEEV
ncbi:MAG: sensor histidine kinase, partial [Nitrospirae bacterium]|nr:sensor histidine kinase [Nitrospirota bacterium]